MSAWLQHTRLPFTISWNLLNLTLVELGCHPSISSSVTPFSSCFQPFTASGSLPMSWIFTSSPPNEYSGLISFRIDWFEKNWCFQTVVLEKTLESPLDYKEIKPVNIKGNELWIPHWKDWCWSWSSSTLAIWYEEPTHWKDPDAGKDWRQKKKGATEVKMFRQHHWLTGHESEQTLGDCG